LKYSSGRGFNLWANQLENQTQGGVTSQEKTVFPREVPWGGGGGRKKPSRIRKRGPFSEPSKPRHLTLRCWRRGKGGKGKKVDIESHRFLRGAEEKRPPLRGAQIPLTRKKKGKTLGQLPSGRERLLEAATKKGKKRYLPPHTGGGGGGGKKKKNRTRGTKEGEKKGSGDRPILEK